MDKKTVADDFQRLFYDIGHRGEGTWTSTRWMGVGVEKNPFDLWLYQEIVHEVRPDLIVECGTKHGGSGLFLANMCDLIGKGTVVTVDIRLPAAPPAHPRLEYLTGSSVDPAIVSRVKGMASGAKAVLVVLDSDHSKAHVLAEMGAYAPLVTAGSYLIVEDGNVNGHPVFAAHGPGPFEAVEEFLPRNRAFERDSRLEGKLLMTFNPGGFLRRIG